MLGNKMDFSSCAIWIGFHKSSHIIMILLNSRDWHENDGVQLFHTLNKLYLIGNTTVRNIVLIYILKKLKI